MNPGKLKYDGILTESSYEKGLAYPEAAIDGDQSTISDLTSHLMRKIPAITIQNGNTNLLKINRSVFETPLVVLYI